MDIKERMYRDISHDEHYNSLFVDLNKTIDVFLAFLDYEIDNDEIKGVSRIKRYLNETVEACTPERISELEELLNKTEQYARKVLYVTEREEYEKIKNDVKFSGYTPILNKLGFFGDKRRYMATRRNDSCHFYMDYSPSETASNMKDLIFDYLIITESKIKVLSELVDCGDGQDYFPNRYIKDILNKYEDMNINYLEVNWYEDGAESFDGKIDELLSKKWKTDTFGVKLLGEAGTGKTTALRRMEYKLAKQYLKNTKTPIPVYIALADLMQTGRPISKKVSEVIKIDIETTNEKIKSGELVLLLDGYNEIMNPDILLAVAREIDGSLKFYSKSQVYLTDRTLSNTSVKIMKDATKLFMKPLSLDQKLKFFKDRTDNEGYMLIQDMAKKNEEYFEQFETPYKMIQFVEIINSEKRIPEDITEAYIQRLIERERNEKKELEMRDIEDFLQALAVYMYLDDSEDATELEVPRLQRVKVLTFLAKIKNALGYNTDTKRFLDVVIGMNILHEENGMIEFVSREVLSYFWLLGLENGMDEVI